MSCIVEKNCNISESMTREIERHARSYARSGTDLEAWQPNSEYPSSSTASQRPYPPPRVSCLSLSSSKIRTCAAPCPKCRPGWPVSKNFGETHV